MELVGAVLFREANHLSVAHPFFAPTILDGGVSKFRMGDVGEQVVLGFLRGWQTEKVLKLAHGGPAQGVHNLIFLAGASHATDTREGIERAIAAQPAQ
jgi:hypothetical protein